jgi:hypothetical protein
MRVDIHLFTHLPPSKRAHLERRLESVSAEAAVTYFEQHASCTGNILCILDGNERIPLRMSLSGFMKHLCDSIVSATDRTEMVIIKAGDQTHSFDPRTLAPLG